MANKKNPLFPTVKKNLSNNIKTLEEYLSATAHLLLILSNFEPNGVIDRQPIDHKSFSPTYSDPFIVIILSRKNLGNLHPVSVEKILTKHFSGMVSIAPAVPNALKSFKSI